jgi:hypothetical protein
MHGLIEHYVSQEPDTDNPYYEIYIFPALALLEESGEEASPVFRLQLGDAHGLFNEVREMGWHPGENELWLAGKVGKIDLAVYFQEKPPEDSPPVYTVHSDGSFTAVSEEGEVLPEGRVH